MSAGFSGQLPVDQDLKKIQHQEHKQDLMAARVIQKFNSNSDRILGMLAKQKKSTTNKDFIFDTMDRDDRLMRERLDPSNQKNNAQVAGINNQCNESELIQNPDLLYAAQTTSADKNQEVEPTQPLA